jgi:hypothetical protein
MAVLAEKDIDQTMAADWAAIQERHAIEPKEVEPVATDTEAPAQEPVVDRGDGRTNDGKFAPKAKEPVKTAEPVGKNPPVKAPKEGAPEPASATPSDPAQIATDRDINRAPSTWKPTARAEWEKLPPTVRAEIHRRETDFMTGREQLLPDARFGKSVSEVVAPYLMLIESEGGTPERAIGELMRTAAALRLGTPQLKPRSSRRSAASTAWT